MNRIARHAPSLAALLIASTIAPAVRAQARAGNVAARGGLDNLDGPFTEVVAQTGEPGEHRFGVRAGAGRARERFVGGYVADDAWSTWASARAVWNLSAQGAGRFDLGTELGARAIFAGAATPAGARSIALTTRISPTVTRRLGSSLDIFGAFHFDADVALDPEEELDTLATPFELGARFWLDDHWALSSALSVGGAFGYGGDGSKYSASATLGLEYALAARAPALQDPDAEEGGVELFVEAGWRGYALAGHISHGPEVRAGVTLFGGHLHLGLAALSRPGPMNPKTFALRLPAGQTYKGQSELALRSDGSTVGLYVAPSLPLGEHLALDLPIVIGQAAYGFYLTGEDRQTPDDRRVSAWENELQNGRDASITIGVDAGLSLRLKTPGARWFQPYAGVHYLLTPGYDAFLEDDYSGASASVGARLVVF